MVIRIIRIYSKMHPNAKYLPDNLRDEEWRWTVHCSARRGGWESERWLRRCRFCWKTPFLVALCNKLAKTMRESLRKLELSPPTKDALFGFVCPAGGGLDRDSDGVKFHWEAFLYHLFGRTAFIQCNTIVRMYQLVFPTFSGSTPSRLLYATRHPGDLFVGLACSRLMTAFPGPCLTPAVHVPF